MARPLSSLQAAFLAKTSPVQAPAPDLPGRSPGSGGSLPASSPPRGPSSSCLKTSPPLFPTASQLCHLGPSGWETRQQSLFSEHSAPFSGRWPRSGTMQRGIVYPLEPSAPLTGVTDGFWWPTPLSSDPNTGNAPSHQARNGPGLIPAVHKWPTPAARDWKDITPTISAAARNAPNLPQATYGGVPSTLQERKALGRISPEWVELLMGFPMGWTDPASHGSKASPAPSPTKPTGSSD